MRERTNRTESTRGSTRTLLFCVVNRGHFSVRWMTPCVPVNWVGGTPNQSCHPSPELGPIAPNFTDLAEAFVTGNAVSSHLVCCGVWIPSSRTRSAPWDDSKRVRPSGSPTATSAITRAKTKHRRRCEHSAYPLGPFCPHSQPPARVPYPGGWEGEWVAW